MLLTMMKYIPINHNIYFRGLLVVATFQGLNIQSEHLQLPPSPQPHPPLSYLKRHPRAKARMDKSMSSTVVSRCQPPGGEKGGCVCGRGGWGVNGWQALY